MIVTGRVIEEQKNYVVVATGTGTINATIKGVAKKEHGRILVGDFVDVEVMNETDGALRKLIPRTNRLGKPSVANVDQVLFVTTVASPPIDPLFIDRYLFAASFYDVTTVIIFNKIDLVDTEETKNLLNKLIVLYENLGHRCITTSAKTGENVEAIRAFFNNRLSVFAGASGVGKSALMSVLCPGREFRTGDLSKHTGRGSHTTTSTILLPMGENGFVADTPGFSHITMPELDGEDVAPHMPDVAAFVNKCRFSNCLHENEPGCALIAGLDNGTFPESRYESYRRIMEEVRLGKRY